MTYIVWHFMSHSENWVPNDDALETLDEVYEYVRNGPYRGSQYKITQEVPVTLKRTDVVDDY